MQRENTNGRGQTNFNSRIPSPLSSKDVTVFSVEEFLNTYQASGVLGENQKTVEFGESVLSSCKLNFFAPPKTLHEELRRK